MITTTHDPSIDSGSSTSKRLNVALWTTQILLAAMFGMAGFMKVSQPIDHLSEMLPFAAQDPILVRFIGMTELSGALGLILPAATRVLPMLTPLAASGLVMVMLLASCFHVSRGEISHLPVTVILGALAAFVAWGRFAKVRISKH